MIVSLFKGRGAKDLYPFVVISFSILYIKFIFLIFEEKLVLPRYILRIAKPKITN